MAEGEERRRGGGMLDDLTFDYLGMKWMREGGGGWFLLSDWIGLSKAGGQGGQGRKESGRGEE